jgi:hypothetical protein
MRNEEFEEFEEFKNEQSSGGFSVIALFKLSFSRCRS